MKILVTGATGHIGSHLVPRLLRNGHQVVACARTAEAKYAVSPIPWDTVEWLLMDLRAAEQDGTLSKRLAAVDCDVVVDLISFTPEQNQMLVEAFTGRIAHFLHCGSIWAYGPSRRVPHRENDPRHPLSNYGKNKTAIEHGLMELFRTQKLPVTVIHPGHISGKRWLPIDPQGSLNGLDIYRKLAAGEPVPLPRDGMTALHHVHGDDVAQLFELAITHRDQALGETFSAAAPYGMTMRGCCEAVAQLLGREANCQSVSMAEFETALGTQAYQCARSHMRESVIVSIDKARQILNYQPNYTTEAIYAEVLDAQGLL